MLVVADVNTIWRARPFLALSVHRPVLGLAPIDAVQAWRRWRWPFRPMQRTVPNETNFTRRPVLMLPGWASMFARYEQRRLWKSILAAGGEEGMPSTLVVTIPHYLHLLKQAPAEVQTVYYASDDYRDYAGWDPAEMAELEREVVRRVDLAIFVSRALADRARAEQPECIRKIHVSMNATDDRCIVPDTCDRSPTNFPLVRSLRRPIVGIVGTINSRLDFGAIRECAALESVGTLVFVGPIAKTADTEVTFLRQHPKCVFVGEQPHLTLPAWMGAFDAALIPYARSSFNRYCSPMRLFDHLASGKPIVATDACDQMRDFADVIEVVGREGLASRLDAVLSSAEPEGARKRRLDRARENTWERRALSLEALLAATG